MLSQLSHHQLPLLIVNENSVLQGMSLQLDKCITYKTTYLDHPIVNFTWRLEQPESDGINITLIWHTSVNPALFSYHINITPETSHTFAETRVTIEVLFDISYNVSIVATHPCGQASPIINTGLFYREL